MRRKFYTFVAVFLLVALGVIAYFQVPKMFGDTVYPLYYADWIVKYSKENGVDPSLVAAVIMQESRFNPKAVSHAGAQGLMQFMPGTSGMVARQLGVSSYSMFDPETSIRFGAFHLKDLLDRYNGDIDRTLAGYNAGPGTVNSWDRQNIFERIIGSDSKTETVQYVKKVKNYQKVYSTMYARELGLLPLIEMRESSDQDKEASIRGMIWSQIFSNIFTLSRRDQQS